MENTNSKNRETIKEYIMNAVAKFEGITSEQVELIIDLYAEEERTLDEINYKLNNEDLNTNDKRELQNRKSDLNNKIIECNEYEEMVGNVANKMIKLDLDDGVAVNYNRFVDDNGKSILAKIK